MKVAALLALAATAHAAQLPLLNQNTASSIEDTFEHIITGAETFAGLSGSRTSQASDPFASFRKQKKPAHSVKKFIQIVDGQRRVFAKYPAVNTGGEDVVYEVVSHDAFPQYQIRLRKPTICDPDVVQYSGYLDIAEDKHLFFWFFESRSTPSKSPLVLWLNGGPGCSSSTGLLFELGPCAIKNEGKSTEVNKYSWSTHANMIFLDQPVNVGYSYSDGPVINNTPDAADDVYAFLQLFIGRFDKYAKLPFHIAAESYGGRYAPLIASTIHAHNQELSFAPTPQIKHIPLASLLIGNGLTEPYTQFAAVPTYACEGPFPVFDDPEGPQCTALKSKVPTCQRLIQSCYNYGSKLTCVPAALYCWSQLFGSFQQLGLNPYDVRKKCDKSQEGDLCYRQMNWIETFLNNATVKAELGAAADTEFASCNTEVNQGFMFQGDGMHNSAAVLPELLAAGVRVLIYAGNADFMCNYIGNEQWMIALESPFQSEFVAAPLQDWRTLSGVVAGKVRTAGGGEKFGAGNFTYVVVHDAGHMVPFDQPEAALDLFVRWISDTPLTL